MLMDFSHVAFKIKHDVRDVASAVDMRGSIWKIVVIELQQVLADPLQIQNNAVLVPYVSEDRITLFFHELDGLKCHQLYWISFFGRSTRQRDPLYASCAKIRERSEIIREGGLQIIGGGS